MKNLERIINTFLSITESFIRKNLRSIFSCLSLIGLIGLSYAFYGCAMREVAVYKPSPYLKNLTQLTFNKADDWGPKVSPDGRYLAFVSERSGNNQI